MARISKTETNSNIVLEYSLKSCEEKDTYDWLVYVSQCGLVHVRRIEFDNTSDKNDEENNSFVLGKLASTDTIIDLCHRHGIEIASIVGTYKEKPVIIGVDLRTMTPFITVRKSKLADYEELEKTIRLV